MPRLLPRPNSGHALSLLIFLALLTLACGSFAPRPIASDAIPVLPTWTPRPPTRTPSPVPTPVAPLSVAAATPLADTPTPTPSPPGGVVVGQRARIIARTGLNIRQEPSTSAALIGRLGAGVLVDVLGGPAQADDYFWWQVQDETGRSGWVAASDGEDLWVTGDIGDPRPVNRAVRLGDRVSVSVRPGLALAIRYEPGRNSLTVRRVAAGALLDIIDGPIDGDGIRWWKVRRSDGLSGWAAEGDSETRWLLPIE